MNLAIFRRDIGIVYAHVLCPKDEAANELLFAKMIQDYQEPDA